MINDVFLPELPTDYIERLTTIKNTLETWKAIYWERVMNCIVKLF